MGCPWRNPGWTERSHAGNGCEEVGNDRSCYAFQHTWLLLLVLVEVWWQVRWWRLRGLALRLLPLVFYPCLKTSAAAKQPYGRPFSRAFTTGPGYSSRKPRYGLVQRLGLRAHKMGVQPGNLMVVSVPRGASCLTAPVCVLLCLGRTAPTAIADRWPLFGVAGLSPA